MQCKRCGREVLDDAKYCPYCGTILNEDTSEGIKIRKKATFKEGMIALFIKIFLFEGYTSRSEFNYGLVFLMIISSILSHLTVTPQILGLLDENSTMDMNAIFEYFESASLNKEIMNTYNLYNIGVALIMCIFLCAPVFRRLIDCGLKKNSASLLTILFVISEIVCSNLLWCILPTEIYQTILIFIEVFSYINLIVLFLCIFRKSNVILE